MKIRKSDRRYVVKKSALGGNSDVVDLATDTIRIQGTDFAWATKRCNYLNWQNLIEHAYACQEDDVDFKGKFL
jgi:hypothetical protein